MYINTSFNMASKYNTKPNIKERFEKSRQIITSFSQKLKENWEKTPINTAARPTYSMKREYCEEDAPAEDIQEIFKNVGI